MLIQNLNSSGRDTIATSADPIQVATYGRA